MPVLEQLIQEEQELEVIGEEGLEIAISDLLEDSFQKEASSLSSHERKLQEIYKYTPYYLGLQNKLREAALLGALIERGDVLLCDKCHQPYRIGEWPLCGVGEGRSHGRVTARNAQSDTVTAYYINEQTGKSWIPGRNHQGAYPRDARGRAIKGYVRHEVRNPSERDKFYKLMDKIAIRTYNERMIREEKTFEPILKENRSNLRAEMNRVDGMSPEAHPGKEWAEHAINKTEAAKKAKEAYSPNTHLDGWEYDSNNQHEEGASYKQVVESIKKMQPELLKRHKENVGKGKSPRKKVA